MFIFYYALKILSVGQTIVRKIVNVDITGLPQIDDKQVLPQNYCSLKALQQPII